jgi:hypothetical protein
VRAERHCVRPDLPRVKPDVDLAQLTAHMGRSFDPRRDMSVWRDRAGRRLPVDPSAPPEDPGEGCPGAWYRNPFIDSVIPYLRRRDQNGARVQNHRLDRCDDRLIVDAVYMVEQHQERAHSRDAELFRERMKRKHG